MDSDQPPSGQPSEPQSGARSGVGPTPREQVRGIAAALAAELPPESLPTAPVPPEAVRELAVDLATEMLLQLAHPSADSSEGEVEGFGFRSRYHCTGSEFSCSGVGYLCKSDATHSCKTAFLCNAFGCTSAFTGLTFSFR